MNCERLRFLVNGKWWVYYNCNNLFTHAYRRTHIWMTDRKIGFCNEWMWSIECLSDSYYLGLMWRTAVARNMFDGHECGLGEGTFFIFFVCFTDSVRNANRDQGSWLWWLMIIIFAGLITHAKYCEKRKVIGRQIPAKLMTI